MNSNHDQDAFEFRFEGAVNEIHARTDRANNPSSRAWATIRAGLPKNVQRAETADPRAMAADPAPVSCKTQRMRKESDMDTALNPGMAAPPLRANRRLFAWVAIALVGVMIASTFFLNGQTPPGGDGNDLAWAPGLGTPEGPVDLASPAASPQAYEYGSEYACEVEPLSADQVMEIVLNPLHAYEERGHEYNFDPPLPEHREEQPADRNTWTTVPMSAVVGTDLSDELEEFGNTFWSCLLTGTTYQVWGMMDPTHLQWSILRNFPVLRTEDDLRQFVEEWGPQKYGSSGLETLPILTGLPPEQAERVASAEHGSIRVSKPRGQEGQETRIGVITMVPATGDNDMNYLELYVSEHPDGTWSVNGVGANPNGPRG